jgi:3-deoxy-7-phosphoheptulonate synthase / chorismate mutase
MSDLELMQYRSEIAELDDEIIGLLIQRFELTDEVGRIKKKNGIPVENKEIEAKILSRFIERLEGKSSKESILKIYKEIFTESKER